MYTFSIAFYALYGYGNEERESKAGSNGAGVLHRAKVWKLTRVSDYSFKCKIQIDH